MERGSGEILDNKYRFLHHKLAQQFRKIRCKKCEIWNQKYETENFIYLLVRNEICLHFHIRKAGNTFLICVSDIKLFPAASTSFKFA